MTAVFPLDSYKLEASSAVARLVKLRSMEMVSVDDFDDGISSDSVIFQNAINYLDSVNGNKLYIPGRVYSCNFLIKKDIELVGSSVESTVLTPAIDADVIGASPGAPIVRIKFKNLQILGNTLYTNQNGINLESSGQAIDTVIFDNVRVTQCGAHGVRMRGENPANQYIQFIRAQNLDCFDNVLCGLYCEGMVIEQLYMNCRFARNGDATYPQVWLRKDQTVGSTVPGRVIFIGGTNNNPGVVNAVGMNIEHATQITILGVDFEELTTMIKVDGSLATTLTVMGSRFGSNNDVFAALQVNRLKSLFYANNDHLVGGAAAFQYGVYVNGGSANLLRDYYIGPCVWPSVIGQITNAPISQTIVAGAVYCYSDNSYIKLDTEASAATDDLDNIFDGTGTGSVNQIKDGTTVTLRTTNSARAVIVKNVTGNIRLSGNADFKMDNSYDRLTLKWDLLSLAWVESSRSDRSAILNIVERVETTGFNFTNVSSFINVTDKYAGKYVWSSSLGKPVYANGSAPGDTWKDATGAVVYTPV